jgi:hypothetical protein
MVRKAKLNAIINNFGVALREDRQRLQPHPIDTKAQQPSNSIPTINKQLQHPN